jgi:lipid II:glycine glycyltransferase (peptidoglycan interpeptide bridge formation enzyme)
MLLLNSNFCRLLLARYNGKIISGLIVIFFGDTAFYVHGGSSNKERNVMSTYLLQWRAICLAKEKKYNFYDFYGIDENKWPGVTSFKKGFGGFEKDFLGTYDLIFNNVYYMFYMFFRSFFRKIKKIISWIKF